MTSIEHEIPRTPSGIEGFDHVTRGGLPTNRMTLVAGTAGSGKTVFAVQFLAHGAANGEPGVFVTFEETADDIRRNLIGFGWDIRKWEAEGKWAFVDASPRPGDERLTSGSYDLGALLARIENAVQKVGARRVALDSLGGVFTQLGDYHLVRQELFRIGEALKQLGVTAVITPGEAERVGDLFREEPG